MKNFNFKLDYNEIDRIIEEAGDDDGEGCDALVDEERKVMVDEPPKEKKVAAPTRARKQWDHQQQQ